MTLQSGVSEHQSKLSKQMPPRSFAKRRTQTTKLFDFLAKSAAGDESAVDDATLNVAAHRLESLIHDRRALLAKRPAVASVA